MVKKKFLFVFRTAPYGSCLAREGIDALLTCGAYEQSISVLFMNEGVTMLIKGQQAEKLQLKNTEKMLAALALYDISKLYAGSSCLENLGLNVTDLCMPVALQNNAEIGLLFDKHDLILHF